MAKSKKPNILLIMADEYRFPRYFKDEKAGMLPGIKDILGFQGDDASIKKYAKYFPGFVKLRENAVVLKNHTIASSACVPSRAAMFTGQYGTRTGVTQTDGILKDGDDPKFPWLQPDGIPTMGDWLRADGYQTHYFGKCHFAHPPDITGDHKKPVLNADGNPREGILFVTDDMITEPIYGERSENFEFYLDTVHHYKNTKKKKWAAWTASLEEGSVCQPCHVLCVRQKDWKLVRYFDPSRKQEDQWEMYDLSTDLAENVNLLKYDASFPTAMKGNIVEKKKIEAKAKSLYKLMNKLSKKMLTPVS